MHQIILIDWIATFYFAGKENAGNYTEPSVAARLLPCVESCCAKKANCNVAFVFSDKCYHVQCISNEICLPYKNITAQTTKQPLVRMVLVNPVDDGRSDFKTIYYNIMSNIFCFDCVQTSPGRTALNWRISLISAQSLPRQLLDRRYLSKAFATTSTTTTVVRFR